jgi:hypothetical protein
MKFALTVVASVVLSLLATWYAIAARVKMLAHPPEQASVLVVPGAGGVCVPRVARPVIVAHVDDTLEWRAVELPGCEGEGVFSLETKADLASIFSPPLRTETSRAKEQTVRVGAQATPGVNVTYVVRLANGQRDTARIVFF